jgi:hypothetical protein
LKFKINQNLPLSKVKRGFDSYEFKLGDLLRGERATLGKSLMDVQRELKINVNIISAIESCDVAGYENSVFISGYVRSYAKLLNINPEWMLNAFCKESGYSLPSLIGVSNNKKFSSTKVKRQSSLNMPDMFKKKSSLFQSKPSFSNAIKFKSILSVFVSISMITGLIYGGFFLLNEIQKVSIIKDDYNFIIIDDGNIGQEIAVNIDPSNSFNSNSKVIFNSNDGPISEINPNEVGVFDLDNRANSVTSKYVFEEKVISYDYSLGSVSIYASRPAWVRIYTMDGEVLDEDILNTSEVMYVPSNLDNVVLRSGNAGSVFIKIGEQAYGPIGEGTSVVKDISLNYGDIVEKFEMVTDNDILLPLKRVKLLTEISD